MFSECCFGKHSFREMAGEICSSQSNTMRAESYNHYVVAISLVVI